ncbi:MAG: NAD-dependent epimerase/dehydratase family protein [Planctomycetes bacterium]|nr:NAD-dependent epimerase/dehydratase family protein [Planctomycetota bacterium]
MPKYLVTGGAGFLGSNVVDALLAAGDKVTVYDDFSTGSKKNVFDWNPKDVKVVEGDVRDAKDLVKVAKGCDYLLHFASIPGVQRSVDDPEATLSVNVIGTMNALLAAREAKVKRVIVASSAAVYGESPVLPKEETMLPTPYSPYGAGMLAGEDLARVFYTTYRLETVCLRFFNLYGPRQDVASEHSGVVARFVQCLLTGKTPVVYGDGKQSRDFTYVSDAVDAVRLACTAPKAEGEVFNIGTGNRVTVSGLLNLIGTLLEREIVPTYADPRPGDIRHSLAEVTKAQEVLGFRPRVSIQVGLVKTLAWYRRALGKNVKLPPPRPSSALREQTE